MRLLLSSFLLFIALVSAASTHKKGERKLRSRKLNSSSATAPVKHNFNDLGRIHSQPLGKPYNSGSESDSDTSSSDSDAETETDIEVTKPQAKSNVDNYYSSTDDLYNLSGNNGFMFEEK